MKEHRSILLTGATGALGPALCADLLADPCRRLILLIRGGDTPLSERFSRICALLEGVFLERGAFPVNWMERIEPVRGDLRGDRLDLSRTDHDKLCRDVDCIIHAAADTQFAGSIDDQWNVNVEGTRRILDLARCCNVTPRVILVSTVCTSGTRTGRVFEQPLRPAPGFVNQYERTKWEAEELALDDPLPLAIARVSIVLGSSARGTVHRMGALHHLLRWFSRRLIPVLPGDERSTLDVIASETVGQFIAHALDADWTGKPIWNIAAGDSAPLFSEFCEICWDALYPGQMMHNFDNPAEPFLVDQEKFDEVRRSRTQRTHRLSQEAMNSISSFAPMLVYPRIYDTAHAEELWGGPLPNFDWRETLVRVLRGFGARKRQPTMAS